MITIELDWLLCLQPVSPSMSTSSQKVGAPARPVAGLAGSFLLSLVPGADTRPLSRRRQARVLGCLVDVHSPFQEIPRSS